jgi:hypothetical protein
MTDQNSVVLGLNGHQVGAQPAGVMRRYRFGVALVKITPH